MWSAEVKSSQLLYRSLQSLPSDVLRHEIQSRLTCRELLNLCMTNKDACSFMRTLDYKGDMMLERRFGEVAECMLKDANDALHSIWENYPSATKHVAYGDEMLYHLGRVQDDAIVTILTPLGFKQGKRGARRVRVVANLFRQAVERWNNDNPDDPLSLDFPAATPVSDYLRIDANNWMAWHVVDEHATGDAEPVKLYFENFFLFDYVDYDKSFFVHEMSVDIHTPLIRGVPMRSLNTAGVKKLPLQHYEAFATRIYTTLTVLLGFKSFKFKINYITRPDDYVMDVEYDGNSLLNDANELLLQLPIFYHDWEDAPKMKPVKPNDIKQWKRDEFVIQRARHSKRRRVSPRSPRSSKEKMRTKDAKGEARG